ncbi:MAG TPA: transglutaminase domain-containing protein [Bacteroidales bacterium]
MKYTHNLSKTVKIRNMAVLSWQTLCIGIVKILKIHKRGLLRLRIAFVILLCCNLSFAQDIIRKKTLSIVGTSATKINQAKKIYFWIASNIHYDVKAYLNGNSSSNSSIETLKRKKGICYDYSVLFRDMCSSINIESYLVDGYSKGFELFKGGGFYRADHCWNAIHIDTTWFLIDATWGSGYLVKKPVLIDKLKFYFFGTPYVNKKIEFRSAPTDKYFNPTLRVLAQTHLPLDPKWQLTENPYSIKSFESDSLNETITLSDFRNRLRGARDMTESQQMYTEGLNGKEFNAKNNFDIANGYYLLANEFDYHSTIIDSSRIQEFRDYREYYIKSKKFISLYQITIDSVFPTRLGSLKKDIKNGKGMAKNIRQNYIQEKKRYPDKQRSLAKRYSALIKRIDRYEKQISLLDHATTIQFNRIRTQKFDTILFEANCETLEKSIIKCVNYKLDIDTLFTGNYYKISMDSMLAVKCKATKEHFKGLMTGFINPLLTEENIPITRSWKDLYSSYRTFQNDFRLKAQNLSVIQLKYSKIISDLNAMSSEYNNQMKMLIKYYQYTRDSVEVVSMYNKISRFLLETLDKTKELTIMYSELNKQLSEFNDVNIELNEKLKIPTKRNMDLFVKYETLLLSDQEHKYKIEKELVKSISIPSARAILAINNKIDNFLKENN